MWRTLFAAGMALSLAGCAVGPLVENPLRIRPDRAVPYQNPLYVPQGEQAYARVFDKTLDVLSDYFDVTYSSRYDGRIETAPSIAPGIEQPWKPGSPDFYQRLLAFCQTIRHRAVVVISAAEDGGYFIDLKVYKELADLPRPSRATAGDATFRIEDTVQRQFEIVEPELFDGAWIPVGRDLPLEQRLLERLSCLDANVPDR